jgi:hypothetical protein
MWSATHSWSGADAIIYVGDGKNPHVPGSMHFEHLCRQTWHTHLNVSADEVCDWRTSASISHRNNLSSPFEQLLPNAGLIPNPRAIRRPPRLAARLAHAVNLPTTQADRRSRCAPGGRGRGSAPTGASSCWRGREPRRQHEQD